MEVYVPEETSGCRYHVWRLVTSPPFENFIMLLIVLNTALLMMKVCIDIYDIQHVTLIPGRFAFYEVILGYFDRAKPILKLLLAS